MKKALGTVYFQNVHELGRQLGDPDDPNAVCNQFDIIILGDGRYPEFEYPDDYSTDGSREFVKKYKNAVLYDCADYQHIKRQKYLDIAGIYGCDVLVVMDTDEYVHPKYNDWTKWNWQLEYYLDKYPQEQMFRMKIFIDREYVKALNIVQRGRFKDYARIIRKPGNKKYDLDHHYLINFKEETKHMNTWFNAPHLIDGVRFYQDSKLRTKDMLKRRDKWAFLNKRREEKVMAKMIMDTMLQKAKATAL